MQTTKKINFKTKTKSLAKFGSEGLMRTEEFTEDYAELGFSKDDIEGLLEIALDKDLALSNSPIEKERYIPCHAVTALGQFEAVEALDPLLNRLEVFGDDVYYPEAVLYYVKKIAYLKLDVLIQYFLDRDEGKDLRALLLEGIEEALGETHGAEEKIEKTLVEYLQRDYELDDFLNATAIFTLVDITGDKYIDLIRKVFETKPVDVHYDGDLEDIEIGLGLRDKRSKPKEKSRIQKMIESFEMEDKIQPIISTEPKIGRNDPCPCGSGKKHKKCCLNK